MDEQQHSLDEIFRQSLGDYREAPPAAAWEKVVAKLDEDEKNRRKGFFWPWPWIVLLLLLTIGGGLFLAARYQNGQPKHEQTEEFSTAESSGSQGAPTAAPIAGTDKASSSDPDHSASALHGTAPVIAENSPETNHSNPVRSTAPEHSEKKSNNHSTKNEDGVVWASTDDESVYSSQSNRKNSRSSNNEATVGNEPAQSENSSNPNSTSQENVNGSKRSTSSKSIAAVDAGINNEHPLSVPAEKKAKKTKSDNNNSGEAVGADPTETPSGNVATAAAGKSSQANKSLNVKSSLKNQTNKASATSLKETATSATGKSGSKTTRKAVSTETQASPPAISGAASTAANKPPADETSAGSSSAKAGSMKAPALAKAEPEKIPTQRRPGKAMAATSPSYEESKAKDDLTQPAPEEAPKAESAPVKDTSATAKAETAPEPEKDSKGGEGASSGDEKARIKPSFSLALHGGYAFAMQNPAPNIFSAGFRLLWHFDPGISLGVQPSIRYGNMSTISNGSEAYQQSSGVAVDSLIGMDSTGNVNARTYLVTQDFDSIVVAGLSAGGAMWQFEIPIILSYKFAKNWFAYGGPSINLGGKLDHSSGDVKTYSFHRRDTIFSQPGSVQPPQSPTSFENYFGTSGLPQYGTYKPAENEWKDPMSLRFGYLIGVGYEHKRLSFDVSLHQQFSGYSDVLEPYKKAYSSPYVQIGVGWKIIPEKTKK